MSSGKDYNIGTVSVPNGGQILKKPNYLITLLDDSKKRKEFFISIDKPEIQDSPFVQVKGFFVSSTEEEIINKYSEMVLNVKKELILEIMFPIHRVYSIRNLVFSAIKPATVMR